MCKKNYVTVLLLSLFAITTNAQVGIGTTTPNASSNLDIVSTNRGLLIPRIVLTATNVAAPITTPATSLLIYNTATAGAGLTAVTPGYYYWSGLQWERLQSGASPTTGWSLLGNAGTNPATNFLGTTDAQNLVFKTNNIERIRVDNTYGLVSICPVSLRYCSKHQV